MSDTRHFQRYTYSLVQKSRLTGIGPAEELLHQLGHGSPLFGCGGGGAHGLSAVICKEDNENDKNE
jgi:hypothetical protein